MDIQAILTLLNITGTAQRTYLELLSAGPQSAVFISKKLSLPRPTIYDALHALEKRSLVTSHEEGGKSIFSISDPKYLQQLLEASASNVEKAQIEMKHLLPELLKSPRVKEPKIKMFTGREGCQQIMRDILWYQDITTYTLWPVSNMLEFLTPEFMEWHNKRRIERNIRIHAIRRQSDKASIKKYPYMKDGSENLREARLIDPKLPDFSMSYWIYGENVAFVSAGSELYGFIVHSKEFANMMLMHFKLLWETAP